MGVDWGNLISSTRQRIQDIFLKKLKFIFVKEHIFFKVTKN